MEPEIIYESEGLKIRRNPKNRFVVASLYYYADPAKRHAEWINTVKAGMTQAQWEKEYEISYVAQFGERVFPEITDKRDLIVIAEADDWSGPVWAGFDYGARNPSSFHVYTYQDGCFIAIWELYKPCKNIPEFASELKNCPYYHRLKYIAADPSIFVRSTHNAAGQVESVGNLFIKEGLTKLMAGNQDENAWLGIMRKHWEQDDPTFKITANCRNMIKEFEQAVYEDYSSDKLRGQNNFKEGMVDKNNHAMDDCKYFFNSQPIAPRGYKKKPANDFASKWYGWGGQPSRRNAEGVTNFPGIGFLGVIAKHPRAKEFGDN